MTSTVGFRSVILQGRSAAQGIVPCVQRGSFDPTAASAATGVVVPQGGVISRIVLDGGATGGTNPTVDVGTSGTSDAYIAEGDADGGDVYELGHAQAGASLTGAILAADTAIYGGVGASAATGGTVVIEVWYYVVPASSKDPSSE